MSPVSGMPRNIHMHKSRNGPEEDLAVEYVLTCAIVVLKSSSHSFFIFVITSTFYTTPRPYRDTPNMLYSIFTLIRLLVFSAYFFNASYD